MVKGPDRSKDVAEVRSRQLGCAEAWDQCHVRVIGVEMAFRVCQTSHEEDVAFNPRTYAPSTNVMISEESPDF